MKKLLVAECAVVFVRIRHQSLGAIGTTVIGRAVLALLLILGVGPTVAVAASNQPTGIIEGLLDGEESVWYTFQHPDPAVTPTASWLDIMGMFMSVTIQGHKELSYSTENALTIEFALLDSPESCPCTFTDADVTHWPGATLFPHYTTDEGTVQIGLFEEISAGEYRLEGSFEAILYLQESMFSVPVQDDSIIVSGTFVIDSLPEELWPE